MVSCIFTSQIENIADIEIYFKNRLNCLKVFCLKIYVHYNYTIKMFVYVKESVPSIQSIEKISSDFQYF